MEIYLVRHTPVHNPGRLCYGQSEISLALDWEQHFEALKQKIDMTEEAIFYSSPYKRCTRLAEFLSGNQFQIDKRISEMHFGNWEQCPWSAIDQKELNLWMTDYVHFQVPGGESFEAMHQRCSQFWDELILKDIPQVFIITHGGVIRSLLAQILSTPLDKVFQLEIDYGSVSKVTIDKEQDNYQRVRYING